MTPRPHASGARWRSGARRRSGAQHASGQRPRRVWPWAVGIPVAALIATGAAFAWDGYQLLQSKDALTQHAAAAQDALAARDPNALTREVAELEKAATTFAGATDGPHWWLAARTPWVRDQATPLAQAGAAVEAIATDALAPLADMGSLDALAVPGFTDGRIDPLTLEPYRDALAQAAATLETQQSALASQDLTTTLPQIQEPFLELRTQLNAVARMVQGGHVAAELLPAMLGGDGPRTYLVMVQNNAEPRATGGIPGAIIELTVNDGRMTMGTYAPASALVSQDGVGGLTEDELRIFTRRMEVYPQDVNFTPEFPRSAELITRFWDAEYGQQVDGVISIDPVALGWMLEGAPGTAVGPFEITGENLAQVMLRDSYLEFPEPAEQDAFFARASAELFGRIVSGEATALAGVERAIEAGRFMLWSAQGEEQALLASTPIAGGFLERADAVGVFVNDGSGSKIGWYIDSETTVTDHFCSDGSLGAQTIEVTYTHTFDGDVAGLPEYVSGGDVYVPAGEFHANVLVYPAVGMGVANLTRDGQPGFFNPEVHDGRTVASTRIVLEPGQSTTLVFGIVATAPSLLAPAVVETPGSKPNVYTRSADQLLDGC